MNQCPEILLVQQYHDGELAPDSAAGIVAHLQTCGECTSELAALRAASEMLGAIEPPRISMQVMGRLHDRIDTTLDRGVMRLAGSLIGVAAALLLVASLALRWINVASPRSPEAWERAAFVSQSEFAQPGGAIEADWIVADLSRRNHR
ncbi:MAG: anti-sigma factor family protein [Tepidisphaeraceae bacterium]